MKRRHHELQVWQEAIKLVTDIYRLTESFPPHELYGLASQMRRSAVSIPSNIAEGAARGSSNEFFRFLTIARGSLSELDTQLTIAVELGYIDVENLSRKRMDDVFGLLGGLMNSIKSSVDR